MDRVTEFSEVTVTVMDDRRGSRFDFDAWVLAVSGRTLALEPVDRAHQARVSEVVAPAFLTFEHNGMPVALRGFVMALDDAMDVRFVGSDEVQRPRRASTRAAIALPVRLVSVAGGTAIAGTTINVSMDGLLAECEAAIDVGCRVMAEIEVDEPDDRLVIPAEVVRPNVAAGAAISATVALHFEHEEGASTRPRLGSIVVERNRALLRGSALASKPVPEQ